MGRPKALLAASGGTPLALHQADLLRRAGADPVCIVLGCDGERIRDALAGWPACGSAGFSEIVLNPAWSSGRLSSIQAGLRACRDRDGILILPVDTVGVRADTLEALLAFCDIQDAPAVRPVYEGQPGRVLWIGKTLAAEILVLDSREAFRLDAWISGKTASFSVDDPAILHNVNTPDDWARVRHP